MTAELHEAIRILCPICKEHYLQYYFSESPSDGGPAKIMRVDCVAVGTSRFSTCNIMMNTELFLALGEKYWAAKINMMREDANRAVYARETALIDHRIEEAVKGIKERASQLEQMDRARMEDAGNKNLQDVP